MESYVNEISQTVVLLKSHLDFVLALIGSLWLIQLINWLVGYRLNILGIYPRHVFGLIGVPCSPFLHGSFNHLFFNSIPLCVLASFILLSGVTTFIDVSMIIMLIGGLGTWLIGRKALHVGASGIIMGYWSYLMVNAYYHPTIITAALAFVCVYYFGGMIFQVLPTSFKASWEAHCCGFIGGVIAAYTLPYLQLHYGI